MAAEREAFTVVPSQDATVDSYTFDSGDVLHSQVFRAALMGKLAEVEAMVTEEVRRRLVEAADRFRIEVSDRELSPGSPCEPRIDVSDPESPVTPCDPRMAQMQLPQRLSGDASPGSAFSGGAAHVKDWQTNTTTPSRRRSANDPSEYESGLSVTKTRTRYAEVMTKARLAEPVDHNRRQRRWMSYLTDPTLRLVVLEFVSNAFVFLNAVIIGVSCDVEPDWAGWLTVDALFAAFFSAELLLKVKLGGLRSFVTGEDRHWNWFELVAVLLAILEVALTTNKRLTQQEDTDDTNLSLFRIMRLIRITRIVRLCRLDIFLDLLMMIKGALGGFKTLVWSVILISLPLYTFAIGFRETLGASAARGNGAEGFRSVASSFFTLFRCTVSQECSDEKGRPIWLLVSTEYGWGYAFAFCVVEVLMAFGLFNVIVAIFIENVLAGAKTNEQVMKRERLRDAAFFATKMTELTAALLQVSHQIEANDPEAVLELPISPVELMALGQHLRITPELLERVRRRPDVREIFQDLALAEEDASALFDTLHTDGAAWIDMEDLCEGISKLRGDARKSDIVGLDIKIGRLHDEIRAQTEAQEKVIRSLEWTVRRSSVVSSAAAGGGRKSLNDLAASAQGGKRLEVLGAP